VVPPEAYRSDDVELLLRTGPLFTSSPTLVETLHAFGIAQAELSDVTHEISEQADTVRTGRAHATGGGEKVTMESHVAGSPTPEEGFDVRKFGVEDGQVTGVVDIIISDFDTMPGEASLTGIPFSQSKTPKALSPCTPGRSSSTSNPWSIGEHTYFIGHQRPVSVPNEVRFLTASRGRISEKSHINNTNKQIKGDMMSSFRALHLPYMNTYGSIIVE
jgi:hypothetical protein